MRFILFFVASISYLFVLFQLPLIESYFVEMQVSWSLSKLLPYAMLLVCTLVIAWQISRLILLPTLRAKRILIISTLLGLTTLGFAIQPLYEGEFKDNITPAISDQLRFRNTDLVMVGIPGCTYCLASLDGIKQLKRRNPSMRIKVVLCRPNRNDLNQYRKIAGKSIRVSRASNPDEITALVSGKFPTYLWVKNGEVKLLWPNNRFGSGAKDFLEKQFQDSKVD